MFTLFECATVAILDYLGRADVRYRIVAVDLNESRRAKMQKIYDALPEGAKGKPGDEFVITGIPDASKVVRAWGRDGCHTVLEVEYHTRARGQFTSCSRDCRRSLARLQP